MSLTPTIYSSADVGAPQLTGQVGALVNLLRAVLVTGYGSGAGAKAGLGWTEEFTATNKAVFRNNPVSGSGYRVRVADGGDTSSGGSGRSAGLRGFSSMVDIDTGNDPTPTQAQYANGVLWCKSSTANATARAWWAIGNERCLYLFVNTDGVAGDDVPYFVGDFVSLKPGDAHNFAINNYGGTATYEGNSFFTRSRLFWNFSSLNATPIATSSPAILARVHSGAIGAVFALSMRGICDFSGAYGGAGGFSYPLPASDGLLIDRPLLTDGINSPRGYLPGLFVPQHNQPFAELERVSAANIFAPPAIVVAKRFQSDSASNTNARGQILFVTNVDWV